MNKELTGAERVLLAALCKYSWSTVYVGFCAKDRFRRMSSTPKAQLEHEATSSK